MNFAGIKLTCLICIIIQKSKAFMDERESDDTRRLIYSALYFRASNLIYNIDLCG